MYVEPFCSRHLALTDHDQVHFLAFYLVWDAILLLVIYLAISAYYSTFSKRDPHLLLELPFWNESNDKTRSGYTKENEVLLSDDA